MSVSIRNIRMDFVVCPWVLRNKKSRPSKDPLIRVEHTSSQTLQSHGLMQSALRLS
jgi:hypothetical protein